MTNEEYSNLRDDIKCLILDLVGDPDIRRAIGEAILDESGEATVMTCSLETDT